MTDAAPILDEDLDGPVYLAARPGQPLGICVVTIRDTGVRLAYPFGPNTQVGAIELALAVRNKLRASGSDASLRIVRFWGDMDPLDEAADTPAEPEDDGLNAVRGMRNAALIFFAAAVVMWAGYLAWLVMG